ncbi:hypothetical protein BGX21_010938 [Mortierella sp. AD011]|nr:hypothetical protein BGX20_002575 [Mortierella sp. AD010]KAF9392829.1 hypothetical protein BGX21_010938 [Mortierella sp. AD011]
MSIRVINMDIKNQKGLRLLTRLQNLEQLIIDCDRISASFGLKDLAWIRRLSKPSITKQLSPRRLRDRLQGIIDSNRIVGSNPEQTSKRTTVIPRVQQQPKPKVDYGQDVIDMSDVGLDQDMAAWKSERQYEKECGVPHWPLLETFQIRYRSAPLWNDENKPDFKSLRHDVRIDVN